MPRDVPRQAKLVVVGSGVIGASITYHLAAAGVSVCLVEAKGLVGATSANCDGGVLTLSKKPGVHLDLALESQSYLRKLKSTLPIDVEAHEAGGMIVAGRDSELPALEQLMEAQDRGQSRLKWLSALDLRRREPAFSQEALAAVFCPEDFSVNPYRLALALAKGAELHGAQVVTWAPVTDFIFNGNMVAGVRTARGDIQSEQVVIAAGVFSRALGQKLGLDIPVVPCRGQIVVTEPLPRIVNAMIVGVDYVTMKHSGIPDETRTKGNAAELREREPAGGFTLECLKSGTILLGGTREFVGFDISTTPIGICGIVHRALRLLPALRKALCIRTYAGLRPQTPDGLPIIGRPKGLEGLYVVTGHSGDGIALAAITGKLVGEELLGQSHEDVLMPFSPNRFAGQTVAATGLAE